MKKISIQTDYITLGQFLKLTDCISTGGQAKSFLQETRILINDEPDNRRGRKLVDGDQVLIEGYEPFQVVRKSCF
ncbi:MAG: S4 domain-containing protein YaaA [Gorillibacterium sp.]|nr:S4 domain-containing protein YaaA [Gorillibacterium sp.]